MAHIEELAKDTFRLSATGRVTILCKGYTKAEVMKKYTYNGFYGDYGTLTEHNNGETVLDCYINGRRYHHRRYKTLRGAKTALSRISDSYTLTAEKGARS